MTEASEASARASASSAPADGSWRDAFLALLTNDAKAGSSSSVRRVPTVRSRGFTVLVRRAGSLQAMQQTCFEQTWCSCLTFRYRVTSSPVFGTLIAALLADIDRLRRGAPNTDSPSDGIVLPDPLGEEWTSVIQDGLLADSARAAGSPLADPAGEIEPQWLERFLEDLGNEAFLSTGRRLVVFCELARSALREEWEAALPALLDRLPERVGFVLSNPPYGVSLPPAPHFLELPELPGEPGPEPEVEGGIRFQLAALRSDQPATADSLGFKHYAEAFARLILHDETTPLTIGIHGPWGKGKSSFMNFVDEALVMHAPSAANYSILGAHGVTAAAALGQIDAEIEGSSRLIESADGTAGDEDDRRDLETARQRRDRIVTRARRDARDDVVSVRFNAWQYEDSTQIWAGLAGTETHELEHALPRRRRLWTPLAYAWAKHRTSLIFDLGLPLVAASIAVALLVAVGLDPFRDWVAERVGSDKLAALLSTILPSVGVAVVAFWALASRLQRTLRPVSETVQTYVQRPDYQDRMGYQHVVLDDLRFVHRRLLNARPRCRVVVFIDDLDRCSSEKVMEILQAINLILADAELQLFVILGIDTGMIYRAIERHYRDEVADLRLPGTFPADYLRKIIQLNFHLPPIAKERRASLLAGLFSPSARVTTAANDSDRSRSGVRTLRWDRAALGSPFAVTYRYVEDTPAELNAFMELQDFLADNPRELKRLVNVHRFVKIVLQPVGAVAEPDQRKLVKWLVFCSRWEELVDDVLDQARQHPEQQGDCIAECATDLQLERGEAADLARFNTVGETIAASDLAAGGSLQRTVEISQLLRRAGHRRRPPERGVATLPYPRRWT